MILGIEHLLERKDLMKRLDGRRVAALLNPASVDGQLRHTSVVLAHHPQVNLTCLFSPQHGFFAEKQENMIESDHTRDPKTGLRVFSLYGDHRRPTAEMMQEFDVLLVDLQDVGCRIYTFLTTTFFFLEACAEHGKEIWILDRPNPAGRPIDGLGLDPGYESFVGVADLPIRHGLTLGEAVAWYRDLKGLDVESTVVTLLDYDPDDPAHYGWPGSLSWVLPSPNMPSARAARPYPGTVLLEGTNLSEGRGTNLPLEIVGAPGLRVGAVLTEMARMDEASLAGWLIRECWFEPTHHKHQGTLCTGFQIHADGAHYQHEEFRPYRLIAFFLKAVRRLQPELLEWKAPPYEYEDVIPPIDILSGGPALREWVDDEGAQAEVMLSLLERSAARWGEGRRRFLIY